MDGGITGPSREEERAHVYIVYCVYVCTVSYTNTLAPVCYKCVYIHTYLQTSYALGNCMLEHRLVRACEWVRSFVSHRKVLIRDNGVTLRFVVCALWGMSPLAPTRTYAHACMHARTPTPTYTPTHCVQCTSSESLTDGHHMAAEDKEQTVKHSIQRNACTHLVI